MLLMANFIIIPQKIDSKITAIQMLTETYLRSWKETYTRRGKTLLYYGVCTISTTTTIHMRIETCLHNQKGIYTWGARDWS